MFWGEIKSESLETQVKCTSLGKNEINVDNIIL